jgi:hypothetical protein
MMTPSDANTMKPPTTPPAMAAVGCRPVGTDIEGTRLVDITVGDGVVVVVLEVTRLFTAGVIAIRRQIMHVFTDWWYVLGCGGSFA